MLSEREAISLERSAGTVHIQGLRLKETELDGCSVVANLGRVNGSCSGTCRTVSWLGLVYVLSQRCTAKTHFPSSPLHYGKYNLQPNLLCFTKKCLFKIPWSIIKRAIELQNTIIIARLGGALAH